MEHQSCHPAALPTAQLHEQCDVRFLRRSGPGGQHRNKVSTAVALRHRPSGVQAEANERRSQAENLTAALFRLRINLALQVRGRREGDSAPSALWRSRYRAGRVLISPTHDDFPSLLAEALDVLADQDFDVKAAAEWLQCSSSQLVRLLQKEPRALLLVNARRGERGQRPLR